MQKLYNEVKQTVNLNKVLSYIVGNKSDLYEKEEVKKNEAEEYANSIKGKYRCVSALSSNGINELFETIGQDLVTKEKKEIASEEPEEPKVEVVTLKKDNKDTKNKDKKKKKCC